MQFRPNGLNLFGMFCAMLIIFTLPVTPGWTAIGVALFAGNVFISFKKEN